MLSPTAKKNRTDDPRSISRPVNREAGHYEIGSVVLKFNPEKSPLYSYKCNQLCYFYLINGAKVIKAINRYHIIQFITSCERDLQQITSAAKDIPLLDRDLQEAELIDHMLD